MPTTPLSDEILQYRQESFDRGDSFVLSPEEGRSLLAEVRQLREEVKLAKTLSACNRQEIEQLRAQNRALQGALGR